MDKLSVRIVIPSYNASRTVERCLEALFNSKGVEPEIVLVDDGENGDLSDLTNKYPIIIKQSLGRIGAGAARNLGAKNYKGMVLVFVDADVEANEYAIKELVRPILNGLADATVGRYSQDVGGMGFAEAYKHLYLACVYGQHKQDLANTFWTALGAVRTELFHAVGGFTEEFRGAGPEDIDLGIKLTNAGGRIITVAEAMGRHLSRFNLFGLFANDFRKGCEDTYIHWKNRLPLTDNRHARKEDIGAVIASWILLLNLIFLGRYDLITLGMIISLYLACRGKLLFRGYVMTGKLPFLSVLLLTYILDLLRGIAVVAGSLLAWMEFLSKGLFRPFNRIPKRT